MNNNSKTSYNDNYSEFLNEYKSKSETKKIWITEKLGFVDKIIVSIQNESEEPLRGELNIPRQIISNGDLDTSQKVVYSIKQLNDVFGKQKISPDLLTKMSAFKRIINLYIDIAKYTADETIAKETINLGNTVESLLQK